MWCERTTSNGKRQQKNKLNKANEASTFGKYVFANQLELTNTRLIEINMHGEWRIENKELTQTQI